MDAYEATRIVFSRIQALDPENASKIMGLLLIQDHGEKELIRLAFGPETLLHSLIIKARKDLGLLPSTTPSTPSTPPSPSPFFSSSRQQQQQNSSSAAAASSRLLGLGLPHSLTMPSPPSRAAAAAASSGYPRNGAIEDLQNPDELLSPNSSYPINGMNMAAPGVSSSSTSSAFYGGGGGDLIDEFQLQDQLSFLNDAAVSSHNSIHSLPIGPKNGDLFYPEMESRSPSSNESILFPYGNWAGAANGHRRSCYGPDICLGSDPAGAGFGWKRCLYFARGYCKNGTSCRFMHGLPDPVSSTDAAAAAIGSSGKLDVIEQCQELLRSKSQRLGSASQLMSSASFPYSVAAAGKCMNFLLQQQQNDTQRAAAAALMLGGDDSHKFGCRSRMERSEFAPGLGMVNPGSRQIYLTFPADSTFREEDVSNYFSIYGPVQDVRIPYQQKRMFGFVTFVYPETVKLILAKGNPHFVCDARVLVKPYKEKGKVPDKKQQQAERGDFSSCMTPSSLDSRDAYDLQLGARMFYNSQDAMLRKLEEQADLQQAIELQGRRLMGLQFLDVRKRNISSPFPSPSPSPSPSPDQFSYSAFPSDHSSPEAPEDNSASPPADHRFQLNHDPFGQADKESTGNGITATTGAEESPKEDSDFLESSVLEHILPDSPFASPTKSVGDALSIFSDTASNNNLTTSTLFPPTSTLDMASFKSCFFQLPRLSSGHGAVGM